MTAILELITYVLAALVALFALAIAVDWYVRRRRGR